MKRLAAIIALAASLAAAGAQSLSDIPPPRNPVVAPLPAMGAWTVTADFSGRGRNAAPPDPGAESSVEYTKVNDVTRIDITCVNGEKTERWQAGTMVLWRPSGQAPIVTDASNVDGYDPAERTRFPGVGWVQIKYYDNPVLFEKQPCYHYVTEGREAWIDCKTQTPVAYRQNGVLWRYSYLPPPTGPMVLPPDFQAAWDRAIKIINRRSQLQKDLSR